MTVRILGIAGSLRAGSYNRKLLAAACRLVPATARAQAEARVVLERIGARVLEHAIAVPGAGDRFEPGGALVDQEVGGRLARLLDELVATARPPARVA
jgi:NAD(P)H-dependent FMN reductase